MSDTAEITSGDIATELKAQSEAASPAVEPAKAEPTQPATSAASVADEHGPIPFERHEAILSKTRRDYEEKLSRLSWAEQHERDQVERAIKLARIYDTAPDRLLSHLSERVNTAAEPKPDVKDEQGNLFYSPEQAAKWAKWQAQHEVSALRSELEERFGPIEQTFTESRKLQNANAQIEDAATLPGFDDYLPDITAAVIEARKRGEEITVREAYLRAGVPQKIAELSTAKQAELKKQWLAELNSTTERVKDDVNPSRAPAASRKRDEDKTTAEMLREEIAARKSA